MNLYSFVSLNNLTFEDSYSETILPSSITTNLSQRFVKSSTSLPVMIADNLLFLIIFVIVFKTVIRGSFRSFYKLLIVFDNNLYGRG